MIKASSRWRRLRKSGVRLALSLAAFHAAPCAKHVQAAQLTTQVIALAGEPVPGGGGNFSQALDAMINDAGQVAFHDLGQSTSNGVRDGVIYRWDNGTVVPIVRNGQLAPASNDRFSDVQLAGLNDSGQVTFFSELAGPTGQRLDGSGIYRGDGGPVTPIAVEGQPAPDGNGSIDEFVVEEQIFERQIPAVNNGGQAAFGARLTGTSGGASDNFAMYLGDGGPLATIVRKGQPAPDGNGTFSDVGTPDIGAPTLNGAGQSAFSAKLNATTGGSADDLGIFLYEGGTLTQIARKGQPAPDGAGTFTELSKPALNEHGQVAFQAVLSPFGQEGIFVGDGETLTQVAQRGQAIPGTTATFNYFSRPALNNVGQIAFSAGLGNVTSGDDNTGIFRSDGDLVTLIAREGQVVPGGNGRFGDLQDANVAFNDRGDVAFFDSFTAGGQTIDGLFYYSDLTGLVTIAREGGSLLGSTITRVRFIGSSFRRTGDKQNGLNNRGQIAFSFNLGDFRYGVAVATAIPEPEGLALAALAGILMTTMRLRRQVEGL